MSAGPLLHYLSPFFSGDIGGQMGLFIGASILTVLEILDYIYEVQCACKSARISQSQYETRPAVAAVQLAIINSYCPAGFQKPTNSHYL